MSSTDTWNILNWSTEFIPSHATAPERCDAIGPSGESCCRIKGHLVKHKTLNEFYWPNDPDQTEQIRIKELKNRFKFHSNVILFL